MGSKPRLMGYRRPNGTMGIRNHVVILPLDDLSNAAAEASMANPDDAALKHLATQHPITPICADFKLDLEYIS